MQIGVSMNVRARAERRLSASMDSSSGYQPIGAPFLRLWSDMVQLRNLASHRHGELPRPFTKSQLRQRTCQSAMTAWASALEMTCWRLAGSQERHRADVARSAVPVPNAFNLCTGSIPHRSQQRSQQSSVNVLR